MNTSLLLFYPFPYGYRFDGQNVPEICRNICFSNFCDDDTQKNSSGMVRSCTIITCDALGLSFLRGPIVLQSVMNLGNLCYPFLTKLVADFDRGSSL